MTSETPASDHPMEMASVLFLDIVGFSRNPIEFQRESLKYLQEIVWGTPEYQFAEKAGQLLKLPTGDGMALVFLHDPVAPVRCAIEIHKALRLHNPLPLRAGVHTGPVFRHYDIKGNINVVGGGINIAQRVMDCGDAGHILVSRAVADVLEQMSEWSQYLHDLGTVEVKHGVQLRIFNVVRDDAGNLLPPAKVANAKTAVSTSAMILAQFQNSPPEPQSVSMADLHVALVELTEESDSGRLTVPVVTATIRNRAWLWISVVAVAIVLTISGVGMYKRLARSELPARLAPVTSYPGYQAFPAISPDGSQVAFMWDGEKKDNYDIYVKQIGQPEALRLTTDPAPDLYPVWAPDGKRIAFRRKDSIYMVSPLGGSERKLSDLKSGDPLHRSKPAFDGAGWHNVHAASGGQMSWSQDGKWLAAISAAEAGIFLLPVDGGAPHRLTNPAKSFHDWIPAFSSDGLQLAYAHCAGLCDLYIQKLDTGGTPRGSPRRITERSYAISGLAWSTDGKSLIFSASLAGILTDYLWRVNAAGREPAERIEIAGVGSSFPSISGNRLVFARNLINLDIWRYGVGRESSSLIFSTMEDASPQFSPDGTKIAFQSDRLGEREDIWVSNADGTGVVQITDRVGRSAGSARWSPDGRWIAFDALEDDGYYHVYVIDAAGGTPRRITTDRIDCFEPSFSRDGNWIYFGGSYTGRPEVWRAPFTGGPPAQLTSNGGLVPTESPDGNMIYYMKADTSPLFAKALAGGTERQVLPEVATRAYVPASDGIYFIGPDEKTKSRAIQFFRFSTNSSEVLTRVDGQGTFGLTVSPDRKSILYTTSTTQGSVLNMIENFR